MTGGGGAVNQDGVGPVNLRAVPRPPFVVALAAAVMACGGPRSPQAGAPSPAAPQGAPGILARLAGQPAIVLPVTLAARQDTLGWRTAAGGDKALTALADSLLEGAFRARGLTTWVYPNALARAARRNPTYLVDPASVRPALALAAAWRHAERQLSEPLASQLRALASMSGARYAFVPTDLEFRPEAPGGRAHLAVAMVDVRLAQVLYFGRVRGDGATTWHPTVISTTIEQAADLVVPR